MELTVRGWTSRHRSSGLLGWAIVLVGGVSVLLVLFVLAMLGLLVMALVGAVIGLERLLGLLLPSYRRRRRDRYLAMPAGIVRIVRFGRFGSSGAAGSSGSAPAHVIDARSYERHDGTLER